MLQSLMTYEDVKNELQNDVPKSILLGNGFSIAYNDIFSFESLFDSAVNQGYIEEVLIKIFNQQNTKDFEYVIKSCESAIPVIDIYYRDYHCKNDLTPAIKEHINSLKEVLVDVISEKHPEKITKIPDHQLNAVSDFLTFYDSVYTLNYDLLLYWAIQKKQKFNDGFRSKSGILSFDPTQDLSCCFLHGGLHLFYDDANNTILKIYNDGTDLIEQIKTNINNQNYPIFVSEGDSTKKMRKIRSNAYLTTCYDKFCHMEGQLVIFGASLNGRDEHIQKAILESRVSKIYFGVSDLDSAAGLGTFKAKAEQKGKKVFYFNHKMTKIWGN